MSSRRFQYLMPEVTKNLLIINGIMWLATVVFNATGTVDLTRWLGLHFWQGSDFKPWQLVTYMFMHDSSSITHLFFNMFSLWMFGSLLEHTLGRQRYIFFYLFCGVGAGLVQELTWQFTWPGILAGINHTTTEAVNMAIATHQVGNEFLNIFFNNLITVGASGSIFGILLAYGMLYPNNQLYIIPIPFPIKAKWYVIGYGAIELLFGVSGTMDHVAHFAHLGGMLFAFILIYYWRSKARRRNWPPKGFNNGGYGNY